MADRLQKESASGRQSERNSRSLSGKFRSKSADTVSELPRLRAVIDELLHTSAHDTLTGLPTRSLLLERLNLALEGEQIGIRKIAVLFIDLDNFKRVNDSLGHSCGDELLCAIAARIVGCIGDEDTASRFGGDEMVVLHLGATNDSAASLGNRILGALTDPIFISGKEIVVSASVGIALCGPGMKSAEQLLREADTALYAAKELGRARLVLFNEEMHRRVERRVQIESDLRAALRESQLYVEYQPQVRLKDGIVVGVEALVRWRHPEWGVVSPADFIPVAEDCGLILKIGQRVLQESCRQLVEWTKLVPGRPLAMTVNISPRQLAEPTFFEQLLAIVEETGIDPKSLCLEITESAMVSATEDVVRVLNQIKQLGIYIAIDDFGIEHSSLSRLRDMPAEVLKIDRCFVDGLDSEAGDMAVVSSILSLAYAMGKHTIAEGVETREQAAILLRMGCEVAQGFFFSRPVAAGQIVPMLNGTLGNARHLSAVHVPHCAEGPSRRGHRYFIDEFLDHIGAPMGVKAGESGR